MKAPDFWGKEPGWQSALLSPLSALYDQLGQSHRRRITTIKLDKPVICVGNIVAGGAGKTPTALAIVDFLTAKNMKPHIISRGYGGDKDFTNRVTQVDVSHHSASQIGDEPLLLARHAPCWVGRDRIATARAAIAAGADILVLDDGLQNPSLYKDLAILVIDSGYGLGNGKIIPAGPLRESLQSCLQRVHAILAIGTQPLPAFGNTPLYRARLTPDADIAHSLQGQKIWGFCGIGRPEKFRQTLAACHAHLAGFTSFADHHRYSLADWEKLSHMANAAGARLVTTEKDAVRLSPPQRDSVIILPVTLECDAPNGLEQILAPILQGSSPS